MPGAGWAPYIAHRLDEKYEMFGYLPGGYARLLSAFQAHLQTLGVDVCVNHPVRRIERDDDGGYAVTGADGEVSTFDRVVVTLPAPTAARVCPQLSEDEIARLADVEYLGIICASVLMKKPLAGYYVTNITDAALILWISPRPASPRSPIAVAARRPW